MSALLNTLLKLRHNGHIDISAEMLSRAHIHEGYASNIDMITDRLPELVSSEFYDIEPETTLHLVSLRFFQDGGSKKITFNVHPSKWATSIEEHEDPNSMRARLYLPIGCKNHGVRFVKGSSDYLSFVYACYNKQSTAGKMARQMRRDIQALQNGHWPPQAALYLVSELMKSIPNGVNGTKGLPQRAQKPLNDLKTGITSLLQSLEGNFNKNRSKGWGGAWNT